MTSLKRQKEHVKILAVTLARDFLPALVFVYLLFGVLFQITVVSGKSMEPTFSNGDILLTCRVFRTISRGDIVVCIPEKFGRPIIKRVIGIAGDHIEIDADSGEITVNGTKLQEPYLSPKESVQYQALSVNVHEGTMFLLGDNRNHSLDSRSQEIGLVSTEEIESKYLFTLWGER